MLSQLPDVLHGFAAFQEFLSLTFLELEIPPIPPALLPRYSRGEMLILG